MKAIKIETALLGDTSFLNNVAYSFTGNRDDSKDLVQETLTRALCNIDKYKEGTNIKAWLYTIMKNIYINNYRKSKKFNKVNNDLPDDYFYINSGGNYYNESFSNMNIRDILYAISQLPDIFRISFELYYKGYKYHEISEILDEPLGTIKSRIHFARKTLTKQLLHIIR